MRRIFQRESGAVARERSNDDAEGTRRRRIVEKLGALAAVLALGLLFSHGLFGRGGVVEVWNLWRTLEARDARVRDLTAENRRLAEAVADLRSDPAAQEREVRERLGYVRPGEIVYREGR